jgi:serine protease
VTRRLWGTALALAASLGLVLSAQGLPSSTRSIRADLRDALRAAARSGTTHLPGRVLVKFRAGLPAAAQTAAVAESLPTGRLRSLDARADFQVVDLPLDDDVRAAAARLAARPDIEYAEPDVFHGMALTPTDPGYARQWNMRVIGMERAWDINNGAPDVVVAVLDSGLAMANDVLVFPRFFNGQLTAVTVPFAPATDIATPGRLVAPYDFWYEDDLPYDMDGHGTHVTGTLLQRANTESGVGVAFNARVMPLKVCLGPWEVLFLLAGDGVSTLPPIFEGGVCLSSEEARAVRYAADNGARVLNMSFGGEQPSAAVQSALQYAVSRGTFVAVAAGNEYEDGNPRSYPAVYAKDIDGVMAIGAVGRDQVRAPYSSTGDYIEIVAPGGNSRQGGSDGLIWQQTYRSEGISLNQLAPRFDLIGDDGIQGTSMAAPHVSGLAALLYSQGVTNPAAVEAIIKHFARKRSSATRDDEYGHGLIDAPATLRGMGIAR